MFYHGVAAKMILIITFIMCLNVSCFKLSKSVKISSDRFVKTNAVIKSKAASLTQLHMDATLIPMIVGATGLIFAGTYGTFS